MDTETSPWQRASWISIYRKLGPHMAMLVRYVRVLNKHNFFGEVHHGHTEEVNIPGGGGCCIPVVAASVVQLFDLFPSAHPRCAAKAIGQQNRAAVQGSGLYEGQRCHLQHRAAEPVELGNRSLSLDGCISQKTGNIIEWLWSFPTQRSSSSNRLLWAGTAHTRPCARLPLCSRAPLRCHQEVAQHEWRCCGDSRRCAP